MGALFGLEALEGDIVDPMIGEIVVGIDGVIGDTGNPIVGVDIGANVGEVVGPDEGVGTMVGGIVNMTVGVATGFPVGGTGDPDGSILVGSSLGASERFMIGAFGGSTRDGAISGRGVR